MNTKDFPQKNLANFINLKKFSLKSNSFYFSELIYFFYLSYKYLHRRFAHWINEGESNAFKNLNSYWNSYRIKYFCFAQNCQSINWDIETLFYFLISRHVIGIIVLGPNFENEDFDGLTRFLVPWIWKSHF